MSTDTTGQTIGSIVGGVIGLILGGPVGAIQGAALGSQLGAAVDPSKGPTNKAPRLSDLQAPNHQYGVPLGRVYGKMAIAGKLGWVEFNELKEVVRKEEVGGKGGSSQTVETVEYFATCAMHFCDNETTGINRLWVTGQLIAELNPTNVNALQNNVFSVTNGQSPGSESFQFQKFAVYRGEQSQIPDARFESDITNAPAWRGMTTIVFYDWSLTNYSNSLTGFAVKAECITGGERVVRFVETLTGFGASANSPSYSGHGDMLLTGYANALVRIPELAKLKVSPNGSTQVTPWLNPLGFGGTTPASIHSDIPGLAIEGGGGDANKILLPDNTIVNVVTAYNNLHDLYYFNGKFRAVLYSGSNASTVYDETASILFLTQTVDDDYYMVAAVEDLFIIGISESGDRVAKWDIDTGSLLATNDITHWPPSYPTIKHTGQFLVSADADKFLIIDTVYDEYLFIDVDTLVEIDRGEIELNGTDPNSYVNAQMQMSGENIAIWDRGTSLINPCRFHYYSYSAASNGVALSSVVSSELKQSGEIQDADIDVTGLNATVKGMVIAGAMTANNAIAPLKYAYMFDTFASGYQIKSIHRGQAVSQVIPFSDFGAAAGNEPADRSLKTNREMDHVLASKINITYIDADRNYDQNQQPSYDRDAGQSENIQDMEIPLVLDANEAVTLADQLQDITWNERESYEFTLPQIYRTLEPCDVIETTDDNNRYYRMRLQSLQIQQNNLILCKAVAEKNGLYTQYSKGDGGLTASNSNFIIPLDSFFLILNTFPFDLSQDANGFGLAVWGSTDPWNGAFLFKSNDNGQTWTQVIKATGQTTVGNQVLGDALEESNGQIFDRLSVIEIVLQSGTLSSVTETELLSGSNTFAFGVNGQWEIIQAATITNVGGGVYELTDILRGVKGTEHLTAHNFGEYLVWLGDTDIISVPLSSSDLNQLITFRVVTAGQQFDAVDNVTYTYDGSRNQTCLSPVYPDAQKDGDDWLIQWTGRSRFDNNWWTDGIAGASDGTGNYTLEILNGSTVVRTIIQTDETYTYTAAQQTTDFGMVQTTLAARVASIHAVTGAGDYLEITA